MTLDTRIFIVEPTNPEEVFRFCADLISRGFEGPVQWNHCEASTPWPRNDSYGTVIGQRLPAWLIVSYATDGPMTWRDSEYPDEYDTPTPWWDQHCINISFDTGYGYKRNGAGCSDFHAWLILEIGLWLRRRGIEKWVWVNEFTGVAFGIDDVEGLLDFGDPHRGKLDGEPAPLAPMLERAPSTRG